VIQIWASITPPARTQSAITIVGHERAWTRVDRAFAALILLGYSRERLSTLGG
jgi:hypothetical protein